MGANLLRTLRSMHLYFGVFIAPALVFFAFTGALQTFGLHEADRGGTYHPPHWAEVLAQIHKKQTRVFREHKPPAPGSASAIQGPTSASGGGRDHDGLPRPSDKARALHQAPPAPGPDGADVPAAPPGPAHPGQFTSTSSGASQGRPGPPPGGDDRKTLPLKLFFLLVCLGLVSSTATGIYMAFKYRRSPALILALLTAGALIPIALLFV